MRAVTTTLAAVAVVLLHPHAAAAHTNANLGDLYQGLLQPLFHPEFLLAGLAVALWSTQQDGRGAFGTCAGFTAGVLAGSALALLGLAGHATARAPVAVMLLVGPLVAAALRVPLAVGVALGSLAGLVQGYAGTAAELPQIAQPLLWTIGLALGVALLGTYANAVVLRLSAFWMRVAVRIAGSWIAAIGLLVGVATLRSP